MSEDLVGYSKDSLKVHSIDGELFVEKYFCFDLIRAYKNIEKQKKFQTITLDMVSLKACPCDMRNEGDYYLLKMPYIEGAVAEEFALTSTRRKAKNLNIILTKFLKENLSNSSFIDFDASIFVDKLSEIRHSSDSEFERYFLAAEALLKRKNLKDIIGYCHGDLTLSNIICESENSFYLIDFLHTFRESPLQDLAKISQDRRFGWSLRKRNRATLNRGMVFFQSALPDPTGLLEHELLTTFEIYEIFCLLRIAPYVKDEVTNRWLHNSLSILLSEVNL